MLRNLQAVKGDRIPQMLQLIRDNPTRNAVRIDAGDDEATIYVYDVIDDYWGISAKAFAEAMAAVAGKTVHLRINSPGGDVFAARAMVTAVRGHQGKVIAHIDGVAASAASFLALAAAEVEMTQGAFFMIHYAWTLAMGNAQDLRKTADILEKVDASIVADYQRKTRKSEDEIAAWMEAETWFTAEEAKAVGFVDRVIDGAPLENRWNLAAYDKAPEAAKHPEPDPVERELAESRAHLERRLRLLEKCPA